jgi:N utilization substance protein A
MSAEMVDAIRQLKQEKNFSEEAIRATIQEALLAAYKRSFGSNENAVVKFEEDTHGEVVDVMIYARKTIVDGVYDPTVEIELEEAQELIPEAELGDEIDILLDPTTFDRSAVQVGKQTAKQSLGEIQKNRLYAEYKDKVGEIIIGYFQRERNGTIYVDLGKVEGVLPTKYQSPRETYDGHARIRALVKDLKITNTGLQVILSRSDPKLVRSILELEVPEIADKTVEIYNCVRECGYRTKVAVFSNREDVDPVGACVGIKGNRIQNVIREVESEKIDILKFDPDPAIFIKNALTPAQVEKVYLLDEVTKMALAVVDDSQFSLAIGKQGMNVRLANRLVDWSIDVKTVSQQDEIAEILSRHRKAADALFTDEAGAPVAEGTVSGEGEDEFECPECGGKITWGVTKCPHCGTELEFEEEDTVEVE